MSSTLTAPAPAASTDHQHFQTVLHAMRTHYKSGSDKSFLAAHPQHATSVAALKSGPVHEDVTKAFSAIKTDTKTHLSNNAGSQKTAITTATNTLQQKKDQNDFKSQMTAQRDKAKKANDDAIDAAYDKAIQLGEQHPESQNFIVSGMTFISDTVTKVISTVVNLISSLVSKIMDIINAIIKPLEEIGKAFGSVVSLIGAI